MHVEGLDILYIGVLHISCAVSELQTDEKSILAILLTKNIKLKKKKNYMQNYSLYSCRNRSVSAIFKSVVHNVRRDQQTILSSNEVLLHDDLLEWRAMESRRD